MPKFWKTVFANASAADKKKFILFALVLVVLIVIGILCIPYFSQLLDSDTRAVLVDDIRSKGPLGVLLLLFLQILQVIVAFIPGEAVQILAGILYGAFGGWAVCVVGTLISSTLIYSLVGKLGMPFVEHMISGKQARRLDFLQENKKADVIMFILFFIPGLPKDVFTYVAPLTKMPLGRFLVISTIARTPALIASTYGGAAWIAGNYGKMALVFIICGALGILGIIFRERILDFLNEKKQEVKEKVEEEYEELKEEIAEKRLETHEKVKERTGSFRRIGTKEGRHLSSYPDKGDEDADIDEDVDARSDADAADDRHHDDKD